ncbi:MAG: gas vesicle protein GvpG [Clostridiaceae bacterium]|nr:gas vesicle protein GvpG [Clostridiaceae bacterium]
MGIIKQVVKVFEVIIEEAEKEWLSEDKYKDMLNDLYIKLDDGEIEEEEYEEMEQEILDELREIREYKCENGIE